MLKLREMAQVCLSSQQESRSNTFEQETNVKDANVRYL